MVDIHSHFLYGLDDGAQTREQSLAMLEAAAATGTTDIVATPHANVEFEFQPEVIADQLNDLQTALGDKIKLHAGCDFHLTFDNVNDAVAHPAKYTINRKRYLMVEFSDLAIFKSTDSDFEKLQAAGMLPVITHPERNPLLRQRLDQLRRWAAKGCYLQVTAGSFFGRFGDKAQTFAKDLMKENLVHFVASDAHDAQHRPPVLDAAYDYVTSRYGEARAERLFVINPAATLTGDPLPAVTEEVEKPRSWMKFWR
jgi:protein-tyrosine phosphatase